MSSNNKRKIEVDENDSELKIVDNPKKYFKRMDLKNLEWILDSEKAPKRPMVTRTRKRLILQEVNINNNGQDQGPNAKRSRRSEELQNLVKGLTSNLLS